MTREDSRRAFGGRWSYPLCRELHAPQRGFRLTFRAGGFSFQPPRPPRLAMTHLGESLYRLLRRTFRFTSFPMSSNIDYRAIDIPEDESPEEYHYTARRAEILQLIERKGSPRLVNGGALARRYDCTRQNIYNDIDKLGEWADGHLGENEALEGETLFWRCIDGLLEEEDWRGAAAAFSDLAEWRRQSDLEEMLERVEALERQRERMQTNDYQLK